MARALVKAGRDVRLRTVERPRVERPHDVIVRVAFAGLCRTDLWAADGRLSTVDPVVLGHELSGTVVEVGPAVTRARSGDRVTVEPFVGCEACGGCAQAGADPRACDARRMLGVDRDGAFAELIRVPERIVHGLPGTVSLRRGAYVEPIAAALAVFRAVPRAGRARGLVLGRGRVAELTARVLAARGVDAIRERSRAPDERFAFAVETSATTDTLRAALDAVERGGTVVLKSRDRAPVGLSIGDAVAKEITLRAVEHAPFEEAISLLAGGTLAVDDLLGEPFTLDEHVAAFERARASEAVKVLFAIDPEHA